MEIIFTNHALERMSRVSKVSIEFIKNEIKKHIYNSVKYEGSNVCKVAGDNFSYLFSINNGKIIVITILFKRKDKKDKRKKYTLGKVGINNLIKQTKHFRLG